MDYTIGPSRNGMFIVINIKGNITRETAMQFIVEAHGLGKQLNVGRYLVDVTEAINTDTTTDDYEFAYSDMLETPGTDPLARVVILVRPDDHSHDFVETVSRNAGFNVTIFTDKDQAERALMEGDAVPG